MNELITPNEMGRIDALSVQSGLSMEVLIERAGRAVAIEILRRYGARKTVVLAGPGNKGRDGRACAAYLQKCGWQVRISDEIDDAELIIDALYGAGLNCDFPALLADQINGACVPVVSIDVPSGVDGLTGQKRGSSVIADLTVTFVRKKPAHVLHPGRALCGEIVVADIGIRDEIINQTSCQLWENTKPHLTQISVESHKFNKGQVVVISGGPLHTGASRLAATAALKAGAGVVSLAGKISALKVQATQVSAIMLAEVKDANDLSKYMEDKRKNAVCIGPAAGVGPATIANVKAVLGSGAACVLDADALTSFAKMPSQLFDLIHKNSSRAVVLTPHEGEFVRLFPDIIDSSKIEKARMAAKLSGAVVLLKGSDTVIAHPDGRAKVNTNAPASLATAGSGDVLAGIITGLLAQGMDGFEAACAGALLHGDAANRLGRDSITAEELLGQICTSQREIPLL